MGVGGVIKDCRKNDEMKKTMFFIYVLAYGQGGDVWNNGANDPGHGLADHFSARAGCAFTVVKWGHTEGIQSEKTSSQKFTVIALDFWRNKLLLVFQNWEQNTIGGQFLEYCHLIWNCP